MSLKDQNLGQFLNVFLYGHLSSKDPYTSNSLFEKEKIRAQNVRFLTSENHVNKANHHFLSLKGL
jgi:hypothetical protein